MADITLELDDRLSTWEREALAAAVGRNANPVVRRVTHALCDLTIAQTRCLFEAAERRQREDPTPPC